jgi:hypothetical protein
VGLVFATWNSTRPLLRALTLTLFSLILLNARLLRRAADTVALIARGKGVPPGRLQLIELLRALLGGRRMRR